MTTMTTLISTVNNTETVSGLTSSGIIEGPTYDILSDHIKSLELSTIPVLTSNGDTLYVARQCEMKKSFEFKQILTEIRHKCFDSSIRCNTCLSGFIGTYASTIFANNKTIFNNFPSLTTPELALIKRLESCIDFSKSKYVVINGPIGTEFAGGFEHLYIPLPSCVLKSKKLTNKTDDYNWFIHQHFSTLERLMKENSGDGIIESLELLLSLLPKITYGDKIQKSTEWFLKYMKKYLDSSTQSERQFVILEALLNQYLVPGYGSERIIGMNLKQTKDTVLEAMSCAHNETALVKMLTKLFNPTTYMRPTATPTEGNIKETMKIFEDANFSTTVMTIENLITKYGGKPVPKKSQVMSNNEAMGVWGSMLNNIHDSKVKGKRGGASGFAKRSNTTKFIAPTTVVELIDRIDEFPDLEISTTFVSPVTLTEYPNTASHLFKYPHLWCFHNGKNTSQCYGVTGYCRVSAICTMGRNVFVGLDNTKYIKTDRYNTCFPTFLNESIQRKCRSAFEKLNTTTSVRVPVNSGQLAYGVGASRKDSHNNIYTLRFKYGSNIFEIKKWE